MNHNFLSYDICEMLPKENPYLKQNHKHYCFVETYNNILLKWDFRVAWSRKIGTYKRDAWTIIDAIMYLETKEFIIYPYYYIDKYNGNKWDCKIIDSREDIAVYELEIYSESHIKAYIEGIKYCLLLINEQSDK